MSEENKVQETFVRIAGTDIKSTKALVYGLTKIKGVSFMFSNAVCQTLKMDTQKKISDLSDKEIETIEKFLTEPTQDDLKKLPEWILNQRKDYETGENLHIVGKDLEFNLLTLKRRLSKIKTYRGLRLRHGLTVRGQRTKSNFRKNKTLAAMKSKTGGKR